MSFAGEKKTCTAGGATTSWVAPNKSTGKLNFDISGTWSGTITLQRRYGDDTTTTYDVATYTSNTVKLIEDESSQDVEYRAGFVATSGDYTSGSAIVRLTK